MAKTELKILREKKNITVEQVSKTLCISKKYIIAIENNDFPQLPERVYSVGFIKNYAEFLGISSDAYVKQYLDYLSSLQKISANRKKLALCNLKNNNCIFHKLKKLVSEKLANLFNLLHQKFNKSCKR